MPGPGFQFANSHYTHDSERMKLLNIFVWSFQALCDLDQIGFKELPHKKRSVACSTFCPSSPMGDYDGSRCEAKDGAASQI